MDDKNKMKGIVYLSIGIVTLIALIAGATYAYFKAVTGNEANANINVGAGTTDNLTFTKGSDLTLNVSADNLSKGNGVGVSEQTNVTATLVANNTTNEATKTYNVYLEILENDLEYSSYETDEDPLVFKTEYAKTLGNNRDYNGLTKGYEPRPELYLTIEGPTNFNKKIEGLKKAKLQTEDDSYDITELREGIYALAEDFQINVSKGDANHQKTDTWNIKVTFKNLDSDQQLNTNKKFSARIIIQAEKLANDLSDVCKSGDNLANCIQQLHKNSVYGASNLIYHDGLDDTSRGETSGALEAGDNSYRYTGSYEKVNNYICLGTDCSNKDNLFRIIGTFGDDGIKVVKADYANKELLGTGNTKPAGDTVNPATNGSYTGLVNKVGSGNNEDKDAVSHRYKGNETEVDRYYWQENGSESTLAEWKTALLNTIHLNTNYYNNIEESYRSLIKKHTWIYGNDNATWNNIVIGTNAKTVYDYEIGKNSNPNQKTDNEKIGLLYVSDYLYGATPKNWNKQSYTGTWGYNMDSGKADKEGNPAGSFPETQVNNDYRSVTDSNWLYMGLWEWLITINNDRVTPVGAFTVLAAGHVNGHCVGTIAYAVRPSFYLESNTTKYKSGTGTASDPYILDV